MEILENLGFPNLIRYGLTGLVAEILFLIVPLGILRPEYLTEMTKLAGLSGFLIFGIVLGFILDALKMYQFFPGYKRDRSLLLKEISKALDVAEEDAVTYVSKVMQIDREKAGGSIFFAHARWVMMNISCVLLILAAAIWGLIAILLLIFESNPSGTALIIAAIIMAVIAWRLFYTAKQEQEKTDKAYVMFCRENKTMILAAIPIEKFETSVGNKA